MEEVFEQLFEGHPDAWLVLELDADRIIVVRCNAEYARRSGVARSELERSEFRGRYAEWVRIMRESASVPAIVELVEGFLRDEVHHRELGWVTLEWLLHGPQGDRRVGGTLACSVHAKLLAESLRRSPRRPARRVTASS